MDIQKNSAYKDLAQERSCEDIELSHLHRTERRLSPQFKIRRRLFVWLSIGIIAIFTLLVSYYLYGTQTVKTHQQCGTTPAEARARGCVFETMGFSWLPKECSDPTIEAEFIEFTGTGLKYWRDMDYTMEVPLEEVQRGDGPIFFVKSDYHRAHCAFLFKKMHTAIKHYKKVDGLISPGKFILVPKSCFPLWELKSLYATSSARCICLEIQLFTMLICRLVHHTSHCVNMLLADDDIDLTPVQVAFVKFPYCGKDGGYNTEWGKQGEWVRERK